MPQTNGALVIYHAVFDTLIKTNKDTFERIQDVIYDRVQQAEKFAASGAKSAINAASKAAADQSSKKE